MIKVKLNNNSEYSKYKEVEVPKEAKDKYIVFLKSWRTIIKDNEYNWINERCEMCGWTCDLYVPRPDICFFGCDMHGNSPCKRFLNWLKIQEDF